MISLYFLNIAACSFGLIVSWLNKLYMSEALVGCVLSKVRASGSDLEKDYFAGKKSVKALLFGGRTERDYAVSAGVSKTFTARRKKKSLTRSKKTRFSKNKSDQSPYFFPYTGEKKVFLACTLKIEYPATQIHYLPCRKASDSGGRAMTACGNPAEVNKRLRQNRPVKTIASKAQSDKRPTGKRLLLVRRLAITAAVTMILLSSHSHHAMGAARRDPRRGEIPVMRRPAAVCATARASGK